MPLHRVLATAALLCGLLSAPPAHGQADLKSDLLAGDPIAVAVMQGTPYQMDDPNWLTGPHKQQQEKNLFAYKLFSALHMLGYETRIGLGLALRHRDDVHLAALQKFQARNGLPLGTQVDAQTLTAIDRRLADRETLFRKTLDRYPFPLYDKMQPTHPNDISRDAIALMYGLPFAVLPPYLRLSEAQMAECMSQFIEGQCLGQIQTPKGEQWPSWPIDVSQEYRFVATGLDPQRTYTRRYSAVVTMHTVLHEYARQFDNSKLEPHKYDPRAVIDTAGFNALSFHLDQQVEGDCLLRRSQDPKTFISRYGYNGSSACPEGSATPQEEFAEAFSAYVVSGRAFRVAARENATIRAKYVWLNQNVFQGIEYDTDLPDHLDNGCNDVPGFEHQQPGWLSCRWDHVWDGTMRRK